MVGCVGVHAPLTTVYSKPLVSSLVVHAWGLVSVLHSGKDHWHVLTRAAAVGAGLSFRSRDAHHEDAPHTHREWSVGVCCLLRGRGREKGERDRERERGKERELQHAVCELTHHYVSSL